MSGIGVGHELSAQNISDFVILEYNGYIGGRIVHTPFGQTGNQSNPHYVVELGANWVHGRTLGDTPNPVWEMVQQYGLMTQSDVNTPILTFDKTGKVDYLDEMQEQFEKAKQKAGELAGFISSNEMGDVSVRAGLRYGGWHPERDAHKQAYEWYDFASDIAVYPDIANLLDQYGPRENGGKNHLKSKSGQGPKEGGEVRDDQFVIDPRGYNTITRAKAHEFLKQQDPRLRLNTPICINADYAVCTFSVGVLQQGSVTFHPPLPETKRLAVSSVNMGTYTKIFMQFNESFWGNDTYFLYADETRSGYYPLWQALSSPVGFPGAHVIFATVVGDESARIEKQTDEQTKAEMMDVLHIMFPHVKIPEPTAIMYPRWGQLPWAYGSYSSHGVGFPANMSKTLAENEGRLWFAGEALAEYQTTTHDAWLNGLDVGR